jgi:hypothetical protein
LKSSSTVIAAAPLDRAVGLDGLDCSLEVAHRRLERPIGGAQLADREGLGGLPRQAVLVLLAPADLVAGEPAVGVDQPVDTRQKLISVVIDVDFGQFRRYQVGADSSKSVPTFVPILELQAFTPGPALHIFGFKSG